MSEEETEALDKEVKKLKRIASGMASQLHRPGGGPATGGLPRDPGISQSTYDACKAWADATAPPVGGSRKADIMITGSPAAAPNGPPIRHRTQSGKCIGCGRCYKVCPRNVLDLVERELDDDDDDADEDNMMVMSIANAMDCIGCGSCGRVCPKDCYTYARHDATPGCRHRAAVCAALRGQVESWGSPSVTSRWRPPASRKRRTRTPREVSIVAIGAALRASARPLSSRTAASSPNTRCCSQPGGCRESYVESVQVWGRPEKLRGEAIIAEYAKRVRRLAAHDSAAQAKTSGRVRFLCLFLRRGGFAPSRRWLHCGTRTIRPRSRFPGGRFGKREIHLGLPEGAIEPEAEFSAWVDTLAGDVPVLLGVFHRPRSTLLRRRTHQQPLHRPSPKPAS